MLWVFGGHGFRAPAFGCSSQRYGFRAVAMALSKPHHVLDDPWLWLKPHHDAWEKQVADLEADPRLY